MTDRAAAIRLDAVSKSYRHYARPLDRLREVLLGRPLHQERHSVSDISFEVGRGEVVGIIGRNGAGKSTLLKMIAGRLEPSSGHIAVNGAIAAILELGTGFHPDLTGRDNVRVGGLCLGLTRRQIEREMDSIIAFAELEESIDLPFRTYSSGMQARLTFATAVTVNPDILIIDEALSVGDNRFQLKSFDRIQQFKRDGKTILLVTHSMGSVTAFCDRAILLERGRVIADGHPARVTSIYHHLQFGALDPATLAEADTPAPRPASPAAAPPLAPVTGGFRFATPAIFAPMLADTSIEARSMRQGYRYGDRKALIAGVAILDADGRGPLRQIDSGAVFQLLMDCAAQEAIPQLYCGFLVRDLKGDILFGADTESAGGDNPAMLLDLAPGERRRILMRGRMWLAAGDYFISAAITTTPGKQSDMWFDAFEFRVVGTTNQHTNSRVNLEPGFALLPILDAA